MKENIRFSSPGHISSPIRSALTDLLFYFLLVLCGTGTMYANPTLPAAVGITLDGNPEACQGAVEAYLFYSALDGAPVPDEYSIDFDAAAEAEGFVDVPYSALLFSPITLVVPGGAAPAVYNATIRVRNALNEESDPVPFTLTLHPQPALSLLSTASPSIAACGDTVTVEISVQGGFTGLASVQYSLAWDAFSLEFISYDALEIGGAGGNPFIGDGNVFLGELTYSWFDPMGFDGEDLPDGTVLLTLKFKALTNAGSASVDLTGVPLALESANGSFCSGPVTVQNDAAVDFAPGPDLVLSTNGPATVYCGDSVVVTIVAESGFNNLGSLQYSVNWDALLLELLSYDALQIGGADPFIGDGNVFLGELTSSWVDPGGFDGEDLPDGTVLLTLTFKALANGGTVSVDLTDTPLMIEASNSSFCTQAVTLDLNATVELLPQPDVVLSSNGAFPAACGDTIDVTIAVESGFLNLSSLQYSVNWDPAKLKYVTNSALQIGGGDPFIGDGNVLLGELSYSWFDLLTIDGQDLPDGTVLLTLSFQALTDVGNATVDITGTPLPLEAFNNSFCTVDVTTENNTDISFTNAPPITLLATGPMGAGCGDTIAVTIAVADGFADLMSLQYSVEWDETQLMYVDNDALQVGGVGGDPAIDDTNAGLGELTYSWLDPTALDGEDLPDSTILLTLTFKVLVNSGNAMVNLTGSPLPLLASNGVGCDKAVLMQNFVDIALYDTVPPMIVVLPPGVVTFNDTYVVGVSPGSCSQLVSWYRPSELTHLITDGCGIDTLVEVQPIMPDGLVYSAGSGDFFVDNGVTPYPYVYTNPLQWVTPVSASFPVGTTTLVYVVSDISGNTASITITVTVEENEPPMAACVPGIVTLPLDATGNAVLTSGAVNNGSSDNCGIDSITVSPSMFDCTQLDINQMVTLIVTDFAGNKDSCTATVDVVDNLPPVSICPADFETSTDVAGCSILASEIMGLELTEIAAGDPLTDPGQYNDNCGVIMITYSLSGPSGATGSGPYPIPGGQEFTQGLTFVTYTFKDAAGNSSDCTFEITVKDLVPPVALDCPADITVNANTGGCFVLVNWTPPTFTDNCPGNLTVTSTHSPNTFFLFGTTQVTYTATDAAGNQGTCTFNVVVNDIQPPVAKCMDFTASLDANGVVTVMPAQLDNNSTDNCFYDYVTVDSVYDCTRMGPNAYTLYIVDGSGNPDSATCILTIADDIPGIKDPEITDCAGFTPAVVELDAACTGTLDAATYALNFTITDNTLNSMPSCPLAFDVEVDGSGFAPAYLWTCADAGVNTVTFRVSDVFGNTTVCTKTVTVNDVTPPTILNAPPDVTVECSTYDPDDFTTLGQITLADVTDACDDSCNTEITIAFADVTNPGACDNASIVTRTWKVTDAAGNVALHTQTISVVDTQAPVLSGIQTLVNLEANNQNDAPPCVAPYTVELLDSNVSDSCTPSGLSFFDITYAIQFPSGSVPATPGSSITQNFPIGTSTVTFTVSDPCGNATQTTITVMVDDVDGPVVNEPFGSIFGNLQKVCDSTFTILNATGNCGNSFTWYRPFRDDDNFLDCSVYNVTETIDNPSVQSAINGSLPFVYTNPPLFNIHPTTFFPIGQTTITYLATDAANNTTTCAFTVEVLDTEAPSINCPGNQDLSVSAGCVNAVVVPNYLNGVLVTDNCQSNVVLTQTPAPGTMLSDVVNPVAAGQAFVVTVVAMDSFPANLTSAPCTFTVTLTDGDAPVPNLLILPVITSFCGIDTIDAPSASDCNGSVLDTIYGTPSVAVIEILPPLVPGGPPRYVIPVGNYAITWSYTDPQNNTTTQLQSVEIIPDNNPPIAICMPPFAVNLNAAGEYSPSLAEIDNGSSDPDMCGPVTLDLDPALLTCTNLSAPVNVTLTVTDVSGNTAQCVTPVTVNDVTAPVIPPVPADVTLEACAVIPPPANLSAIDKCDNDVTVVFVQDTISFTSIYQYTIRRTWTATDDSGNATTGTQIINIADTQAPVFAAATPDTLVVVTDLNNLNCLDTVAFNVLPFVTDCDSTGLTITNNRTGQGANYSEILQVGTYSLVFTAQDGSGHVSTHEIVLVVEDGTDPIAACINGVSISLQPSGSVIVTPANINAGSTDNCTAQGDLELMIQRLDPLGAIGNSITFTCPDADGITQHPVQLYVTDEAGNVSTCETFIIVQDNTIPVITFCPSGKTVQCTDDLSPAAQGTAIATDNCLVGSVAYTDSTAAGTGNICTVLFRTWKALDLSGNMSTCLQVLNIQDTVKPVFTVFPTNDTLTCTDTLPVVPVLLATDNCDADVLISLVVDTIDVAQGACAEFSYTLRRTWTAADDCGNTSVYTQQLVITDAVAPAFPGMPDTLMLFTADFPPNLNCLAPVSFDAEQYLSDCQPNDFITVTNNAPHGNDTLDISGSYAVGEYTVVFTATDACGNTGMDSVVVIVRDNSIPTVLCNNNVVIALGTNGTGTLSPDDIDLGSTDNCGIDTMFLSVSTFDCSNLGLNPVTLTVVDASGNANFCTVTINVTPGTGGAGFSLTVTGTPESYLGAGDGTALAVATGGSGQFSYTWSNGAMTPGISGLSAGVYTVTVVDSIGGCTVVDTAVVDSGPSLVLTIGGGSGCQEQTISVPVTVDNFFNINDFTFTVHVDLDSVGTILGITPGSINPLVADGLSASVLAGNNLGINWSDTALTLPGNTILFYVDVQLGAAMVGSTSPLVITDTPVNLQFTQDSSGVDVLVGMVGVQNDTIAITCAVGADLQIGGDIRTWRAPTLPVPGVEVSLTGTLLANQTTDPTGTYLFDVALNANTIVKCFKETAGNAGITGSDILLIKRHVLNIQPLTSPYQFVAADVSGEGNLSILDYARIQEVALGTKQHITGSPDWKFVPKSYVFPTPLPLIVPPPDSISHLPVDMSYLDDDFVAVRMGDVNGNVIPSFTNDDVDDRGSEVFRFQMNDRAFAAGEFLTVPFRASGFTERSGYQMTVDFDPAVLDLTNVLPGVLPEMDASNFGTAYLSEGMLSTLWVSAVPKTVKDGEVLFVLTFRALRDGNSLADVLRPGSEVTRAEAYDRDGGTMKIDFEFVHDNVPTATFALYQNQPNPFSSSTVIGFRLPESEQAVLRIFDASGRQVKMLSGYYDRGYHEVRVEKSELGGPGVYYYELETARATDRKKMIVVE